MWIEKLQWKLRAIEPQDSAWSVRLNPASHHSKQVRKDEMKWSRLLLTSFWKQNDGVMINDRVLTETSKRSGCSWVKFATPKSSTVMYFKFWRAPLAVHYCTTKKNNFFCALRPLRRRSLTGLKVLWSSVPEVDGRWCPATRTWVGFLQVSATTRLWSDNVMASPEKLSLFRTPRGGSPSFWLSRSTF